MSDNPNQLRSGLVPIPDPTEITTREISRLREEVQRELTSKLTAARELAELAVKSVREVIETRLDGMDKTHVLLQDSLAKAVGNISSEASRLETLFNQKLDGMVIRFDSIQTQFKERDIRTDRDKIAASTAVDAALQAQKEAERAQNEANAAAITKSESAFTKQIDGLKDLIEAVRNVISSDVNNIKSRLDRGEGGANPAMLAEIATLRSRLDQSAGGRSAEVDTRANIGTIAGVIAVIIAGLSVMITLWGHSVQPVPLAYTTPPSAAR